MTEQFRDAPIFDADQHMYETADALIKFLPEKYSRAVQYAQFGRQTRIVINNRVTDFIPNPTFERVAAPGAHEKFFAGENTEGLTAGQGHRGPRGHPHAGRARGGIGPSGRRRGTELPDAGPPGQIGRESGRARGCQYGELSVVAVSFKKKKNI